MSVTDIFVHTVVDEQPPDEINGLTDTRALKATLCFRRDRRRSTAVISGQKSKHK